MTTMHALFKAKVECKMTEKGRIIFFARFWFESDDRGILDAREQPRLPPTDIGNPCPSCISTSAQLKCELSLQRSFGRRCANYRLNCGGFCSCWISQFESYMPSQPPRSLAREFGFSRKWRHFRRLAAKSPVSGEEYRASRAEGGDFWRESLLDKF